MTDTTIVKLIEQGVGFDSPAGKKLVRDLAKAADGVITYKEFREKHKLNNELWKKVPHNTKLIEAAKAERERQRGKKITKAQSGGDVVELHPMQQLIEDHGFVVDLVRYRENLLDEKSIRKKYRLVSNAMWEKLADDDELVRKVEEESVRRVRDGSYKRERSQQLVVKAPDVLAGIMNAGSDVSPRHKIDSAKTLSEFAQNPGDNSTPDTTRFVIQINLGSDVQRFSKSIRPLAANEHDPDDPDDVVGNTDVNITGVIANEGKDAEPI